jgi:excinuclease ABC subunit C
MTKDDINPSDIPDEPGVYFFKRGSTVLYVGKATSLRSRVRSYFDGQLLEKRGAVVDKAVRDATRVTWEVTDSVLEALLFEARLIKKLQPYGNTSEKDDKSFNYVVITNEEFPRVLTVRGRELAARVAPQMRRHVFGPFTQGGALKEALNIIRHIFPYFDERSREAKTVAFNQSIGVYPTYDKQAYRRAVRNIVLLFEGKKQKLVTRLERQMRTASKDERFEEASEAKRQLFALTHIRDTSLLKDEHRAPHTTGYRIEAFDTAHLGGSAARGVMTVLEDGEPLKSDYRIFTLRSLDRGGDDYQALREIMTRRLAHPEWGTPKLMVIDGGHAHLKVARSVLSISDIDIDVVAVVKDERHRPREILGKKNIIAAHRPSILLANAEAHRFSITRHRTALRKQVH